MTTIHFIRHGQSTWNAEIRIQGSSDPDLSELGQSQARALVGKLPTCDRHFSSDLRRTRQTIDLILEGKTDDVEYRSALREIHLGPWEGMLLSDATEQYPEQADNFRHHPEKFSLGDAETFASLQARAHKAVNEIVAECPNQTVLVVSHGALLKSLLIDYENQPIGNIWHDPHMDNCGHSIVEYGDGSPKVVKFADLTEW